MDRQPVVVSSKATFSVMELFRSSFGYVWSFIAGVTGMSALASILSPRTDDQGNSPVALNEPTSRGFVGAIRWLMERVNWRNTVQFVANGMPPPVQNRKVIFNNTGGAHEGEEVEELEITADVETTERTTTLNTIPDLPPSVDTVFMNTGSASNVKVVKKLTMSTTIRNGRVA